MWWAEGGMGGWVFLTALMWWAEGGRGKSDPYAGAGVELPWFCDLAPWQLCTALGPKCLGTQQWCTHSANQRAWLEILSFSSFSSLPPPTPPYPGGYDNSHIQSPHGQEDLKPEHPAAVINKMYKWSQRERRNGSQKAMVFWPKADVVSIWGGCAGRGVNLGWCQWSAQAKVGGWGSFPSRAPGCRQGTQLCAAPAALRLQPGDLGTSGTWSNGWVSKQGLWHHVGVRLLLLHQGNVLSASCFSVHFGVTLKASPSKSK